MGPYKFKKPRDVELSANVVDESQADMTRSSSDDVCYYLVSGHSPGADAMSALVKSGRDALKFRCPLYPTKQTLTPGVGTSALAISGHAANYSTGPCALRRRYQPVCWRLWP
jgi:hypothetical protein